MGYSNLCWLKSHLFEGGELQGLLRLPGYSAMSQFGLLEASLSRY